MKRGLATFGLGVLCLVLQGVLPDFLPQSLCPDFLLLLVLALGLHWSGWASGLALVAALGYVSDASSGSLMGQHALVYLMAFAATALASRPLNLRGRSVLMLFGLLVTLVAAFALVALTVFFTSAPWPAWGLWPRVGIHALINGLLMPFFSLGVVVWLQWLAGDDGSHRPVQLDARPGSA